MKKAVIVFDADDTLWMNEWQYSRANVKFFARLYEFFHGKVPNLHYLKDRFFKIDGELFKEWGVRRGRVAESMLTLYHEVREWVKWRFGTDFHNPHFEEEIRKIGDMPFNFKELEWLPEAENLLPKLKAAGHTICLLTCYDKNVFPKRAQFLRIDRFFEPERMRVTEFRKTKEDFIKVSGWAPEKDKDFVWVAVGNADSDVLPALEISEKWNGVRVPHGSTSKYCEDNQFPPDSNMRFPYFMPPPINSTRALNVLSLSNFEEVLEGITPAY